MVIKLTHPGDYIEEAMDEENQTATQADKYDDGQTMLKETNTSLVKDEAAKRQTWKQYAREQLSQDIILDAIMLNSTPGKEARRLRVPLSCIVDYKGFRAMVIAYVDIDALKPELGLYAGDY